MEPNYQIDQPNFLSRFKDSAIELIEFIAVVASILVIIRVFIAEPHKVSGSSMVPNFHDGDYIITNKLAARFSNLERGEVIILQNPLNTNQDFIKRIVGLPGETFKLSTGHIYVNNQLLDEPYLPSGLLTIGESFLKEGDEVTIPENNFFVMGDNRSNSSDSREWGFLKQELVIGQAFLRYWPANKMTPISISTKSN